MIPKLRSKTRRDLWFVPVLLIIGAAAGGLMLLMHIAMGVIGR